MHLVKRNILRWITAAAAAATVATASASVPDLQECMEGGDFIGNAARGRDNGIARSAFLEQMTADFAAIRSYPPQLRWFAKDADDEQFLFAAAAEVFDRPNEPESHRAAFLRACLSRASA
jgi:hypothetical protein